MDATDRDDGPPGTRDREERGVATRGLATARAGEELEAGNPDEVAFETVALRQRSPRTVRWRLVAIGAIAALVVGIGALGPRPDGTAFLDLAPLLPRPSGPTGRDATDSTPRPTPTRAPGTPLPVVTILDPGPLIEPITLMRHEHQQTRLLLDPGSGQTATISDEFQAGLWVGDGEGGTLCICRLTPWDARGERARIVSVSWDALLQERSRVTLVEYFAPDPAAYEPTPVAPSIALDVALSRDRTVAIVGSAIRDGDDAVDRVEAFAVATGEALWSRVLTGPGAPGDHSMISVRLSPAGDRLIATVLSAAVTEEMKWHRSSWLVALQGSEASGGTEGSDRPGGTDGAAGTSAPAPVPVGDPILIDDAPVAENSWCDGEGFATAERYVLVCNRWSPAGQTSTWVRLVAAHDGALIRDVPITDSGRAFGSAIVDGDAGNVYLWDGIGHRIVRIDATSGSTAIATFGLGSGTGAMGRAFSLRLGDHRTDWRVLSSAFAWGAQSTLVGSRNGATLFALAVDDIPEPFRGAIPQSSGIWVFDAASLELLTIIPPAAVHAALSLTPDGRHLLATGIPGLDEQSRPSDWGASLSIFDARDGHLVARFGDLASNSAPGPSLVWPPSGE